MNDPTSASRKSLCVRYLGIDAPVLVAIAAHLVIRTGLVELLDADLLSGDWAWYLWMFVIGASSGAAALLAIWLVWGPGRLATRGLGRQPGLDRLAGPLGLRLAGCACFAAGD